jgi:hypothetical protein
MNKNMGLVLMLIGVVHQTAIALEPQKKVPYYKDLEFGEASTKDYLENSPVLMQKYLSKQEPIVTTVHYGFFNLEKYCTEYNVIKFSNYNDKQGVLIRIRPDDNDINNIIYYNTRIPYKSEVYFPIAKSIEIVRITIWFYDLIIIGNGINIASGIRNEYKYRIGMKTSAFFDINSDNIEKSDFNLCETMRQKKADNDKLLLPSSSSANTPQNQGMSSQSRGKSQQEMADKGIVPADISELGNLRLNSGNNILSMRQQMNDEKIALYKVFPGAHLAITQQREPAWYEILQVDKNATRPQILKAFKNISEKIKRDYPVKSPFRDELFIILNSSVSE